MNPVGSTITYRGTHGVHVIRGHCGLARRRRLPVARLYFFNVGAVRLVLDLAIDLEESARG